MTNFSRRILSTFCFCFLIAQAAMSQQSTNTVKYQVTYDLTSQVYTAWVIPDYSVPNANNSASVERGATALFSLLIPKDFVITNITDVNGVWDKNPLKLGPGNPSQDWSGYTLDATKNYYVIGKSPSETTYGTFQANKPVALFTFKGTSCNGPISPLPPNHPFINAADSNYSLNVANSFYSLSGQPAGGNQVPLEQFINILGQPASCANPMIVANADNVSTQAGDVVVKNVLTNDKKDGGIIDPTTVTITLQTQPSGGTVSINPNGEFTYTPNNGFIGKDCFIYRVCDKVTTTACDTALICVTVNLKVILAANDSTTTLPSTPVVTNVLANDSLNGGVVNPAGVNIQVIAQPDHGQVTINPTTGNIVYTPDPGFNGLDDYEYQICEKTDSLACQSAHVFISIVAGSSDLNITKTVDKTRAIQGDILTYTIKVTNNGPNDNANIVVSDTLSSGVTFVSSTADNGSYNLATKKWSIPFLANGEVATLTIKVKVVTQGVTLNYATIEGSTQPDPNTNNNIISACTTVPINLCTGEKITVGIPSDYTNVQWYKDGVAFATTNTILITQSGTYSYTATNATCPTAGCCPIIVDVKDCCKPAVCVPFTITKVRK